MNRSGEFYSNIAAADRGDGINLKRQSSLLPGEVRTPTMIVTLSEAWGDSSVDWAAPGSSSVWEEEAPSHHSAQTPLRDYGHSDVWASATGSPLLGDSLRHQGSFTQPEVEGDTDLPETADLAAATLQALSPEEFRQSERSEVVAPLPRQTPLQPRYTAGMNHGYESRFGSAHKAPSKTEFTHFSPRHEQAQPSLKPPQQHTYFTVQENSSTSIRALAAPSVNSHNVARTSIPGIHGPPPSTGGSSHMPRFDDEAVAHSIIASAGLPLSMHSLLEYIHNGQPPVSSHTTELGTTHNTLRNYPNLSESPAEEEPSGGRGRGTGNRGAQTQRGGYGKVPQSAWGGTMSSLVPDNGFSVRGQDAIAGVLQGQAMAAASTYVGNFTVSGGSGHIDPSKAPTPVSYGVQGNGAAGSHKSESKYLSDLLHFHANFFPPPPPPRVPKEERRNRAELWYHYASKWDITHRLPPPPRTPLPEMELEYRMRLQQMTRVPYHGDGWLQMSERWFDITQGLFDFPDENVGNEVNLSVIYQHAVLS